MKQRYKEKETDRETESQRTNEEARMRKVKTGSRKNGDTSADSSLHKDRFRLEVEFTKGPFTFQTFKGRSLVPSIFAIKKGDDAVFIVKRYERRSQCCV